jgi:hypothetical protein
MTSASEPYLYKRNNGRSETRPLSSSSSSSLHLAAYHHHLLVSSWLIRRFRLKLGLPVSYFSILLLSLGWMNELNQWMSVHSFGFCLHSQFLYSSKFNCFLATPVAFGSVWCKFNRRIGIGIREPSLTNHYHFLLLFFTTSISLIIDISDFQKNCFALILWYVEIVYRTVIFFFEIHSSYYVTGGWLVQNTQIYYSIAEKGLENKKCAHQLVWPL